MTNDVQKRLESWKIQSSDAPGFYPVITPENCECRAIQMYRLNLPKGQSYTLETGGLEMHPVLISGEAALSGHPFPEGKMTRFDSFYLPGKHSIAITARADAVFYIAAAPCEGIGRPSFRKYDAALPIGDIHQIHGAGLGRREVMFTLDPRTPASRLICGLTWGGQGAWTSWPPHQHEKDLEEAYCYFDMDRPKFGLHLSYLHSGGLEEMLPHVVTSGTMVQAPCGYHPTVASPAVRNSYLWCLASFSPAQRSYDLAVLDPEYQNY